MSRPKINIIKTHNFMDTYNQLTDEKTRVNLEMEALKFYGNKLYTDFLKNTPVEDHPFVVNTLRAMVAASSVVDPEGYQFACELLPEEELEVIKGFASDAKNQFGIFS